MTRVRPLVALVNSNLVKPAVGPIALDYLHGPLVQAGYDAKLLDLCFSDDWRAAIVDWCEANRPDFWAVTFRNTDDMYYPSRTSFVGLVGEMIERLRAQRAVPVIVGGVGFSVMPEALLVRLGADYGVAGEGEVALPMLLDRLAAGRRCDDVRGLVWRDCGRVRRNPARPIELSSLPARTRTLIDNARYFSAGGMAGIETQRGCNRACAHCVEPFAKGAAVRRRGHDLVLDEIRALLAQGVDTLHINDSEFNLDVEHAIGFCEALERSGLSREITWYAYGMPHPFPDALAARMAAAGCGGMNFGCDSGSPKILRLIQRTFRQRHIADAVATARRHGLRHILELLVGFPGETQQDVRDSIDFVKRADPELVAVTVGIRLFAHTPLGEMARREGLDEANPNLYGPLAGNEDLAEPLFYVSAALGPDPEAFVAGVIGDDPRFLSVNDRDFNYYANGRLVEAIAGGARGAYWKILSDLRRARPPAETRRPGAVAGAHISAGVSL